MVVVSGASSGFSSLRPWLAAAGYAVALTLLYALSEHNYLLFHTLVELASVVVACGVFIVFWNTRQFLDNGYFLFLGVAWAAVAVLDLVHALAYKGVGVFPDGTSDPATQLWIAARYLEAASLLLAPLFVRRRLPVQIVLAAYAVVVGLVLASVLYWRNFPQCFVEGEGLTPFKIVSEYVICLMLAGAIGMLVRQRQGFDPTVLRLLIAASAVTIASELAFTLYRSPFGLANFTGHVLKVVGFYLIYKAVIQVCLRDPYRVMFRELHASEKALKASEERLSEAKLAADQARMAADAANEAKSRFLANISHELRTPMGAILGMTELALEEQLSATVRDYLATTKESAEGLLELLNELLDFSRMEAGKFELDLAPFGLRGLLDQTVRTMGIRAYEKGLELICDVAPDVPESVVGDRKRLRQILVNLIGNAIKFTAQGEVVVQVGLRSQSERAATLELAVADTGIGIKPEDRQRIFSPFAQADAATNRQYGGTGLGLTITASLVSLMGGRIDVESQPGRGSRFYFSIELGLPPAWTESPETSLEGLPNLRGARVLIVDDNPASRRVLEQVLGRWELKTELVGDAPAALAMIHEASAAGGAFDAVIVDATIPGTDGFTLVQWLRHQPGLVGATILMVSPADRRDAGQRCQESGATLLDKPLSQSGLYNALMQALAKTPPPSPTAPAAASAAPPLPPPTRSLRVLLAEDTPANQKLVSRVLSNRGHTVEVVANGRDAVHRVEQGEFDVVLMDVQMPTMDGFQATAAIRALHDPRKSRLPIIALTAHAMKGDQDRCVQAGMDSYLAKPINVRELAESVERWTRPDGK
jgi:signal transduction histidine kinase/DNA-binding response OmpR family regulator